MKLLPYVMQLLFRLGNIYMLETTEAIQGTYVMSETTDAGVLCC